MLLSLQLEASVANGQCRRWFFSEYRMQARGFSIEVLCKSRVPIAEEGVVEQIVVHQRTELLGSEQAVSEVHAAG